MNKALPFVAVVGAVLIAGLIAWLVNPYSIEFAGWPVFGLCVALAFAIQWVAFIPAFMLRSERFFDLTGSATYTLVALLALMARDSVDLRSGLIAGFVLIWAIRLGVFLARRIHKAGFDRRFNSIKNDIGQFLMTWTLQGLWVTFAFAAGLAALTSDNTVGFDAYAIVGALIWIAGFSFEVVADRQKSKFRSDPDNQDDFITSGLWARSRHPNYFGEIVLWLGIAVMAFPVLEGWQYVTLLSPVFTWVLLTKISGVRMLEARGKKRWGDDPAYQAYLENTPTLVPRIF